MADNPPPTPPPNPPPNPGGLRPTLPGSTSTGRLKNPTTRLPLRTGGSGKIVVMLSSVAKAPPAGTQALPRVAPVASPPVEPVPKPAAPEPPASVSRPPPLPPAQVKPGNTLPAPSARPQLSATTYVKLPPKTTAPGWSALSGRPVSVPTVIPASPIPSAAPAGGDNWTPVTAKPAEAPRQETKKTGAQHIPPIKLNEPSPTTTSPVDGTLFIKKSGPLVTPSSTPKPASGKVPPLVGPLSTPAAATPPATPEAIAPAAQQVTMDFSERRPAPATLASTAAAPEVRAKPGPSIVPPQRVQPPASTAGSPRPSRPPPLPPTLTMPMGSSLSVPAAPPKIDSKPALASMEKPAPPVAKRVETSLPPPSGLQTAPPMLERAPEPPPMEKLPLPVTSPAPVMATPHVAPPMLDRAPEPPQQDKLPPPITKPVESAVYESPILHVAPPMLEKAPEPVAEKLAQPHLPMEARKAEPPIELPSGPPMQKAPAMITSETAPSRPSYPPRPPRRSLTSWLMKSKPVVVASTLAEPIPAPLPAVEVKPVEAKPAAAKTPEVKQADLKPSEVRVPEVKPDLAPPGLAARSLLTPVPVVEPPAPVGEIPKIAEARKESEPVQVPEPPIISEPTKITQPPEIAKTPDVRKASKVEPPQAKVESKSAAPIVPAPLPASAAVTSTPPPLPTLAAAVVAPVVLAGTLAAATRKGPVSEKKEPADKEKKPAATAERATKPPGVPIKPDTTVIVPPTRAERAKKRRFLGVLFFYLLLFPLTVGVLFWASLHFGRDTRVEGQVIPPPGTVLSSEVWIVTDFRSLASGITEDLAAERMPLMQEIQERQDHVQRAQADVAAREERIRLIQENIKAAKGEIDNTVKQAREATQKVWDVDGAEVDSEYKSRMEQLKDAIGARARALHLNYNPDATYNSPEVWANAYRLALYEVPAGVDGVKEHGWLADQMKQWRDFQKSMDDRTEQLREKAAQIKLGPAPKVADLNGKIDELQQRIEATQAEEVPLKSELQQAQADLVTAQAADAGLDDKYYQQLYSLPGEAVIKHIPLATNGRFTWVDDNVFLAGEKDHFYYMFARATRADGRQYWALGRVDVEQYAIRPVLFEPASFISTKSILRPNLPPDEQAQ